MPINPDDLMVDTSGNVRVYSSPKKEAALAEERRRIADDDSYYAFTGPGVAISCHVDWDEAHGYYHAHSKEGFHGTGDSRQMAALMCFQAWCSNQHSYFQQSEEFGGKRL